LVFLFLLFLYLYLRLLSIAAIPFIAAFHHKNHDDHDSNRPPEQSPVSE
jgi:hypothetical protein